MAFVFFLFLLLLTLGPLALLFGADSRRIEDERARPWWPGSRR